MKVLILAMIAVLISVGHTDSSQSQCYGTSSNGSLEGGVQLPASGINFTSYSGSDILRQRVYVHSNVKNIMLEALETLQNEIPDKRFMYAETGFESGGSFPPHKTHQNGLSIDIMVPVFDKNHASVYLPTHEQNRYGYNIEFDKHGRYEHFQIDFDALAALLISVHQSAQSHVHDIWRVFFAPDLQPLLFSANGGEYLKQQIQFNQHPSWMRHDEHIHIDFAIPCISTDR